MNRFAALLLALMAFFALPLHAQGQAAADKSFLENWLETNLSAAGRTVTVTGFSGALSSQATMEALTIADDDGVWFTMRGVTLDWTRSALLTGRLEVDALTADEIEMSRRPVASPMTGPTTPQPTASDFALPELPISINIGQIEAKHVILGAPVLGVAAELRLAGSGHIAGGAGAADLQLERIDGAKGLLHLAGSYANDSRELMLDLSLDEGANGIAAALTGLPGGAPLALTISGSGPIEAFTADISLATDGTDRLSGQVALTADAPATDAALGFKADLAGDPGPLLAPDYRAFFGPDTRLMLEGQRQPDGRLEIAALQINTDAMQLSGSADINPLGWIERAELTGTIAGPDGAPVLLPLGGDPTRIDRAALSFDYDSARGDGWTGALTLQGLTRDTLSLASARITGAGPLTPGSDTLVPQITGQLDIAATGIAPADPALASAIGPELSGHINFTHEDSAPLQLSAFTLKGADYGLSGALTLKIDWTKLDLIANGTVALQADNLTRFAALSGQALAGGADLKIAGSLAVPGGPFDLTVAGSGRDLAIGAPWFDRPFAGASTLSIAAMRDETGTRIDHFTLAAPGGSASASGKLTPEDSHIEARLDLGDASEIVDGLTGALSLSGTADQTGSDWAVALDAIAPGETKAQLSGVVTLGQTEQGQTGLETLRGDLSATIGSLAPYSTLAGRQLAGGATLTTSGSYSPGTGAFRLTGVAEGTDLAFGLGDLDRLTTGASRAEFALERGDDHLLHITKLNLQTPELTATVTGSGSDTGQNLKAEAHLRDLGLIVPGLSGAFTAKGTASLAESGWQVDASGTGPGGTTLNTSGQIAADGSTANLAITGRAPLALANSFIAPRRADGMAAFDLALNGPFALASLSGSLHSEGARLSLPTLQMALDPVTASARISGLQAQLNLTASANTGGQITLSGPVTLSPPYTADLTIEAKALGLSDPALYDTTASGTLAVRGPLTGGATISGAIALGVTELRVPETGLGMDGTIAGLQHIAAPADVRATQARAGMTVAASGSSDGPPFGLDIALSAPSRIFLRGRGLDAELGGSLRLGGTTQNILAEGGFQLIRGRLDLLGNRLVLTEGTASLQGSLDPYLHLVAETQAEDVTVRITIDGLASDPKVTFSSSPDLPEDEILARLLFGRGLDQISPLQALKLASAIATLSGQGGNDTIGRLRSSFGLDDLDVTTGADGTLQLRAGTYISDNIYTDVTVGQDGKSEINLNLSITPDLTARGSAASDGSTGIGLFFEKDY